MSQTIESGCETLLSTVSSGVPKNVTNCFLFNSATSSYMTFSDSGGFQLRKFYSTSSINNYVFNLIYLPGYLRSTRFVNAKTNAQLTVNTDSAGNPISTTINGSVCQIVTGQNPQITGYDTVRFTDQLFSLNSYDYDSFFATNRNDLETYTMNYSISNAPAGNPTYKKTLTISKNGTNVPKIIIPSSRTITHAKLYNSANPLSNVFVKFEDYNDPNNNIVYPVNNVGINKSVEGSNGISSGLVISNFPNSSYNKCLLGWLNEPLYPPQSLLFRVLKNLNEDEYIFFFPCTSIGSMSYVRYKPTTSVRTYNEFGSINYVNEVIYYTTNSSSPYRTNSISTFIDGLFYNDTTSTIWILADWMSVKRAFDDINFVNFPYTCTVGSPLPITNRLMKFVDYENISFPAITFFSDGFLKYVYKVNISTDTADSKIKYIKFLDERDSIIDIDGVTYFNNKYIGYKDTHWEFNKYTGTFFKIIQRKESYVMAYAVNNYDVISTSPINITLDHSIGWALTLRCGTFIPDRFFYLKDFNSNRYIGYVSTPTLACNSDPGSFNLNIDATQFVIENRTDIPTGFVVIKDVKTNKYLRFCNTNYYIGLVQTFVANDTSFHFRLNLQADGSYTITNPIRSFSFLDLDANNNLIMTASSVKTPKKWILDAQIKNSPSFSLSNGIYTVNGTNNYNNMIIVHNGTINIFFAQYEINKYFNSLLSQYFPSSITELSFYEKNYKTKTFINSSQVIEWIPNIFVKFRIDTNKILLGENLKHIYEFILTGNDTIESTIGVRYTYTKNNPNLPSISNLYILDKNDRTIMEPFNRLIQISDSSIDPIRIGTTNFFIDDKKRLFQVINNGNNVLCIYPDLTSKIFVKCVAPDPVYVSSEFEYDTFTGTMPASRRSPSFLDMSLKEESHVIWIIGNQENTYINSRYIKGFVKYQATDHPGDDIVSFGSSLDNCLKESHKKNNSIGAVYNPTSSYCWTKSVLDPSVSNSSIDMYKETYFFINRVKYWPTGSSLPGVGASGNTLLYGFFVNKQGRRVAEPSPEQVVMLYNSYAGILTPMCDPEYTYPQDDTTRDSFSKFTGRVPLITIKNQVLGTVWQQSGQLTLNTGTNGFSIKAKIQIFNFNSWMRLIDYNNGSNGNQNLIVAFPGTDASSIYFEHRPSGNPRGYTYTMPGNFKTYKIYDICFVMDNFGNVSLFIDGSRVGGSNTGEAPVNRTYINTYIGRSSYSWDGYFSGYIHNLDIYNYALNDSEAKQIEPYMPNIRNVISTILNDFRIFRTDTNQYFYTNFGAIRNTDNILVTFLSSPNNNDYDACFNFEPVLGETILGNQVYLINPAGMCGGQCRTGGAWGSTPKTYIFVENNTLYAGSVQTGNNIDKMKFYIDSMILKSKVSNSISIPISIRTSYWTDQNHGTGIERNIVVTNDSILTSRYINPSADCTIM